MSNLILIVFSFVVMAVVIQAWKMPKLIVRKDKCCQFGLTCPHSSVEPPNCIEHNSPVCSNNTCTHNPVRLERVYYPGYKPVCCAVMNDPAVYYSDCSYKPEECDFIHGICVPKYFKLFKLYLNCNGKKRRLFRYLPYCCTCHKCPFKKHAKKHGK